MSKTVKKVAKVALPIAGAALGGPIGGALGSTLSGATLGAIGGALGGAAGGLVSGDGLKGAIKGAALGGAGGYLGNGGLTNMLGSAAHTLPAGVSGPVSSGSGILGALGPVGKTLSNAGGAISGALSGTKILGGNPLLTLATAGGSIYSANAGVKAAEQAAQQQAAASDRAIAAQEKALNQVRTDLQPFREAGSSAVNGLTQLVNDPNAQAAYIQSNPFYQSLADDAKNKLLANQAARGKIGSGGTAEALQNSLLLLGNDLLNQSISQRQNLASLGSNAAAQTGTATQNTANNIGGYVTNQGNAQAAGTIGGYNAKTGAINNAIGTQVALYGIDKGVKI